MLMCWPFLLNVAAAPEKSRPFCADGRQVFEIFGNCPRDQEIDGNVPLNGYR